MVLPFINETPSAILSHGLFISSYFTKGNLIFFLWNLQRTLTGLRTNSASQARKGFKNIIITNNDSQNLLLSQQSIKVGLIKFIMFI